jgi:NAD dependent epimerase/dehydratase
MPAGPIASDEAVGEPSAGRRVLVTGAAGFIGSNLVEYLVRRGDRVRAFVRYNSRNDYGRLETCDPTVLAEVEVFTGDLTNPEAAIGAAVGCDVVLHLGALIPIPYSYRHPREFVDANVTGTLNVLEAARRADVSRLVHVSSSEVYGTAMTVPISESHPLSPQSPYAATRVGADQLALTYWYAFRTPVVVARPFNTFGPRQSARAVIPTIISQALAREVIHLGDTATTRDFVYVEDTAAGINRCSEVPGIEGETFNLGTGREFSIADVVARVVDELGVDVPVVTDPDRLRPPDSEVLRLVADASKAKRALGWSAETAFEEGLSQTIAWISAFRSLYKAAIYNV